MKISSKVVIAKKPEPGVRGESIYEPGIYKEAAAVAVGSGMRLIVFGPRENVIRIFVGSEGHAAPAMGALRSKWIPVEGEEITLTFSTEE